jgi:hypothetical protein
MLISVMWMVFQLVMCVIGVHLWMVHGEYEEWAGLVRTLCEASNASGCAAGTEIVVSCRIARYVSNIRDEQILHITLRDKTPLD